MRRRFSIEPGVAWATATRPRTPQLPPRRQSGPSVGLEIALATRPPISKKLPPVAAVPIRKNRGSWASATAPSNVAKNKLAQTRPRQICQTILVSRGETVMGDDTTLHRRLQPDCKCLAMAIRLGIGVPGGGDDGTQRTDRSAFGYRDPAVARHAPG